MWNNLGARIPVAVLDSRTGVLPSRLPALIFCDVNDARVWDQRKSDNDVPQLNGSVEGTLHVRP
jgi:hypothetical protein